GEARKMRRGHSRPGHHPSGAWRWSLESGLRSKDSRAVPGGGVGRVPIEATRWRPILLQARFGEGDTPHLKRSTVPTLLNVELVGGQEVFGRPAQIASGHGVFCPTPLMPKPRQNIVYLSAELNRLCRMRVSTYISIRALLPVGSLILPLYSVVAHRSEE